MQVEIWSDIICPWCYVGKRRFEMALADYPGNVQVIWRSFELDPDAPPHLEEKLVEMLARKYDISVEDAEEMNMRVTRAARDVGLEYRLSKARRGNTFDAHRLLHYAASRQLANQATERIMQAYFCEELAVGERCALAALAPAFGIEQNDALAMLETDAWSDAVRSDEARAAKLAITSVPFFLFDEKIGLCGAQSVDVFSDALKQAGS